jgi:hypothetical protein
LKSAYAEKKKKVMGESPVLAGGLPRIGDNYPYGGRKWGRGFGVDERHGFADAILANRNRWF